VLGGGLAGLSATLHVRRAGGTCRTFEKDDEPGGHARTRWDGGFGFDRTGHLLHLRDPDLRALALEVTDGEVLEIERRSRVWSHGVLTRYPWQANTFGLPPEVAHECVMGLLEARARGWEGEPRTFEEFSLRHFGEGFSRRFMIPYNERLWGVPASEITSAWCQRFVPIPSVADVIAGAVGLNDRELGYNQRFLYPARGIGELAKGLARAAGELELGRAPKAIDFGARMLHFEDESVPWDALISTIPLDRLFAIGTHLPPEIREAASRLRCQSLQYLDVAMKEPAPHDLHWLYVPEARYPFYRVGCYSNFSRALVPDGCSSHYVELASREPPDLATLVPEVLDSLREMGWIRDPEALRFARLRRLEHAYVLFDHEWERSLAVLLPWLAERGVHVAGRYGVWGYSSMEDALRMGRDAGLAALADGQ